MLRLQGLGVLKCAWARECSPQELQESRDHTDAAQALESTFSKDSACGLESTFAPPLESPSKVRKILALPPFVRSFYNLFPTAALNLCAQPESFALLDGDLCCHYPHGKLFSLELRVATEWSDLASRASPPQVLSGQNLKARHACQAARAELHKPYSRA